MCTEESVCTPKMSHVVDWTNLPKGIEPDFVSHNGDYDFPLYLSEKEEWVIHKRKTDSKGKITIYEPFLIMELNRFVPYLENNCVKFHPLNMPHIKIGKIEIVGFVMSIYEDAKFYQYRIDDGTGSIVVYFEKKSFETQRQDRRMIDEKYSDYAKTMNTKLLKHHVCPKHFPNPRPEFRYPDGTSIRDMAILEHNWSLETNNGLLGMPINRCDYVHAIGYCALDFMFNKRPEKEITFEILSNVKLHFLANKVIGMKEKDYNAKLYLWLNTVVQRRYDEHSNEPEILTQNEKV
ncbi:uncharacterized protein LOC122395835 isoform X2 [Colletes gigas]|uniref:uncharacterized protein LOC122395835 isoform X2 n=1 Tax=Colletes gigas TaxID=935657 RepID=UPI001C9BA452|nr:uncharacterized protein LOC122395835 isoform X2 [Colletes gigas]